MKTDAIQSQEITFVIQGPECPTLQQSINNIKFYFPSSKIILSSTNIYTTKITGSDLQIVSEDPGANTYTSNPKSRLNNINRQIVSTFAGLKEVKTNFVFKLRSDFILTGNEFLNYFNMFQKTNSEHKVFNRKILACSYFTRNPRSYQPYPFHISDLIYFGLTEDVKKLYNVPLMPKEYERFIIKGKYIWCRFMPEQYLLLNCLKNSNFKYYCNYYDFVTDENIIETEKIFASNFILLNFDQFCIKPTKDTFDIKKFPRSFASCYTPLDWLKLYKQYCDPEISLKKIDKDRRIITKHLIKYKFITFFAKSITLFVPFPKLRRSIRDNILGVFK